MTSKTLLLTSFACCVVLIALVAFFLAGDDEPAPAPANHIVTTTVRPAPVVAPAPRPPAPAVVETEEPVAEPDPEPAPEPTPAVVAEEPAPAVPREPPLPDLNDSDAFVQAQIGAMNNADAIRKQLTGTQIIRKFVVLVDGMSRGDIPARDLPVTKPAQDLAANELSEELYVLDPASFDRFNMLVNTLTAIDGKQAAALYRRMSPLFENAFAELGYPGRTFAGTLQQAIDNVLAARQPSGEILLKRPSVNYRFADPQLENRTELEKLLIRMGPDNAAKIQAKAREIRALLAD